MGCLIRKDVGKVKGFRDKSKPKLILKNPSYFQRVVPAMADYNSINKRNDGVDIRTLSKKSVVILGCGSLGSSIAKLLLQAGLRQLTLVDPDIMSWGNISRHELGADSVSKSKVSELKQQLGSFYPQVEISAIESSWESIPCKENLFYKNHLVVSAIGNWISERALNSYLTKNEIHVPVVYSWLEEYACVGHAVLIKPAKVEDACFACGFTDMGAFQYTVTDFSHKQDSFNTQEVGCGNNFQPYGSIQANPVHSLAAELAIDLLLEEERNSVHRIWLGSSKYIEKYGGKLTNFGLSISNNSPNIKSTIYERKWLRGEKCRNH
jgi:molybdopterin/thiamine biosynthesis adenylyltransferase